MVYFEFAQPVQALSLNSVKKTVKKTVKKYTVDYAVDYVKEHKNELICKGVAFAVEQAIPGGSAQKKFRQEAAKKFKNFLARRMLEWSVNRIAYELCMEYGPKIKDELL